VSANLFNFSVSPLNISKLKRYFAQLPGTDDLGRRVYLVKGFEHDLKVHNNDDVNKVEIKI
jgi:hypothetical protein